MPSGAGELFKCVAGKPRSNKPIKMNFENPGLFQRLLMKIDLGIFYWFMCTFRAAVRLVDVFLNLLFGFTIQYGSRQERLGSLEYDRSAQVVNLMGRGAYSVGLAHQLHNFVWSHATYVHPRYILEHDNITLMGITPSHAFFCVSEPDVDVFDMKVLYTQFRVQGCVTSLRQGVESHHLGI